MPCTLRRASLRSIKSSIVIRRYPPWVPCPRKSSASLGIFQLFRHFRLLIVFVQRIATRRESVAWGGRAIAEGPANQLTLDPGASRSFPEKLGIAQYHPAKPHEVDPSFGHRGLRLIG